MRNYFELEDGSIMPFEKVLFINFPKNNNTISIAFFGDNDTCAIAVPIEQFADYKDWLALKQQALEDSIKPKICISPLPNELDNTFRETTVSSDFSKPKITEKMILTISKSLDLDICKICEFNDIPNRKYPCCECNGNLFKLTGNALDKINEEWQES